MATDIMATSTTELTLFHSISFGSVQAFAKGTFAIVDCLCEITKSGAVTIVGGGDSVAAVELSGKAGEMSHISTGGGASLELLEGKILPGVAALDEEVVAEVGGANAPLSPSGSGINAAKALKAEALVSVEKLEI